MKLHIAPSKGKKKGSGKKIIFRKVRKEGKTERKGNYTEAIERIRALSPVVFSVLERDGFATRAPKNMRSYLSRVAQAAGMECRTLPAPDNEDEVWVFRTDLN